MKFAVCTSIDHYGLLEELGCDFIELAGNQVAFWSEEQLNSGKEMIEQGNVKCCGFNAALPPDIALCGVEFNLEKAKAYAELLCKRGSVLGISAIGIGSPKSRQVKKGDDFSFAWLQVESFLKMFAEVAQPYGITVMYESLNHTESEFGLSIREGADLVQRLNLPNLKIVFDIYHMHMEQEEMCELEYALPYVHHVHIAERVVDERRYPSENLYEFYRDCLSAVKKSGYQGAISTEAFDGDVREGVARSLALVKKIMSELED